MTTDAVVSNPYFPCQQCGKVDGDREGHTCPFGEEIHYDYTQCNCCRECESNCALAI